MSPYGFIQYISFRLTLVLKMFSLVFCTDIVTFALPTFCNKLTSILMFQGMKSETAVFTHI